MKRQTYENRDNHQQVSNWVDGVIDKVVEKCHDSRDFGRKPD